MIPIAQKMKFSIKDFFSKSAGYRGTLQEAWEDNKPSPSSTYSPEKKLIKLQNSINVFFTQVLKQFVAVTSKKTWDFFQGKR